MDDLMITLVAVVPVVLALLAAVAPPKSEWIRPVLLPSVLMQLALAATLGASQFLFGFLFGGVPPRELSSAEFQELTGATSGFGLPFTLALAATLTAVAAAVAFGRAKNWKHATPWVAIAIGCFSIDRAFYAVVALVGEKPLDQRVDVYALIDSIDAAVLPWMTVAAVGFLASFPLMSWSGWWTRARWTGALLPGLLMLCLGAATAFVPLAFRDGVFVGLFTGGSRPTNFDFSVGSAEHLNFMFASGLLQLGAGVAAVLGLLSMFVARKQKVPSTRALLRGLAWFPLAWTLWATAAVIWSVYMAPNIWSAEHLGLGMGLEPAFERDWDSYAYTLVEASLNGYTPIIATGAVFSILLFCLAGPLRASRRSDRPSTAA
jgi:hypothetical protein